MPIKALLESDTAGNVLRGTKFTVAVPCRRYWKHNLKTVRRRGTKLGGNWIDGIHFRYQGGQVRSLLSLISYLSSGQYREKFAGVKIPPTNLQGDQLDEARSFAGTLWKSVMICTEGQHSFRGSIDEVTDVVEVLDKPGGDGIALVDRDHIVSISRLEFEKDDDAGSK